MLNKTITILIAVALSTLVLPMGASDEVVEKEYVALSFREGVTGEDLGLGIIFFSEPKNCGYAGCGPFSPLGGRTFFPYQSFEHVVLDLDDVAFEQPATFVCLWHPEGDRICDDDDHRIETGCGSRAASGIPFAANEITVWAYSVHVTPALDVCLASTGMMTATFS